MAIAGHHVIKPDFIMFAVSQAIAMVIKQTHCTLWGGFFPPEIGSKCQFLKKCHKLWSCNATDCCKWWPVAEHPKCGHVTKVGPDITLKLNHKQFRGWGVDVHCKFKQSLSNQS